MLICSSPLLAFSYSAHPGFYLSDRSARFLSWSVSCNLLVTEESQQTRAATTAEDDMAPKRDLPLKSIWDETLVIESGMIPKHRAKMWNWLINHPGKDVCDVPFESWSVAKKPAQILREQFVLSTCKIVEQSDSSKGDTHKLLLELQDGHRIETVIMKHTAHSTVCVSSQIGCQMGCRWVPTRRPFPRPTTHIHIHYIIIIVFFPDFAPQGLWALLATSPVGRLWSNWSTQTT
jgi:hypothetical protein